MAAKALTKMRIVAIPLTRPRPNLAASTAKHNRLTYYQFQISRPPPSKPQADANPSESPLPKWWPEEGVVNWATGKAASIWAGFGKAEGGWKLKTFQTGERLVDRLDFEELALKGIEPSLGPSLAELTPAGSEKAGPSHLRIPLIYPPSQSSHSGALEELRLLLDHRTPRHRKGFYTWMLIAPLTAPFMIIPIIPNLPFFFCVWRSWSHYRAYRASQYLNSLLEGGAIVPESSEDLEKIYKDFAPHATTAPNPTDSSSSNEPQAEEAKHEVLLRKDAIPVILDLFGLKPTAGADLMRAIEQARVRVKSGRVEL